MSNSDQKSRNPRKNSPLAECGIHAELTKNLNDADHLLRLHHFHRLCEQIEKGLKKGDLSSHISEIELDMNNMKVYLQSFFTASQKTLKDPTAEMSFQISQLKHQLLEYRYLFGQFFHNLLQHEEGLQLRNQFLFVDQYFESVEFSLKNALKSYDDSNQSI